MTNWKKTLAILALSIITLNYSFATWVVATWSSNLPVSTGAIVSPIVTPLTNNTGAMTPALKVDWVDFLDDKTLSIKISAPINWISKDSEVKILEDLSVATSTKDLDNAKKVTVKLNSDLLDGSSYSLVSVSEGLDTSIDFDLSWDKTKIVNKDVSKDDTSIEYISVIDPKNIEVYFNKDLTITSFEFKMFKELKVESMFLDTVNLNVKMLDSLVSKKDYIAILSLKDETNKDIEVENSLYDFVTPEFAVTTPVVDPTDEPVPTDILPTEDTATWVVWSGVKTEEAAMAVTATPDTGAKTNVLLFITFILTLAVFLIKRKTIKV